MIHSIITNIPYTKKLKCEFLVASYMTCRETRVFRTFADPTYRQHMTSRLLDKYLKGRRSARHVLESIAALRAQNLYAEADALLIDAVATVEPVPLVLWREAWDRAIYWDTERVRFLLRMARDEPRLHGLPEEVVSTTHGLVALMHEVSEHNTPWAVHVLYEAVARLKSRSDAEGMIHSL